MENQRILSTYGRFFLQSLLAAIAIMFCCMALGEIAYDKNLFSGFLKRPEIWSGIIIETALATLFMTSLGSIVLFRFRSLQRKSFVRVSALTWSTLGILLIVLYSHFYWKREWHLTAIAPGLIFGWILPGILTVACFVLFSVQIIRQPMDRETER